MRRGLLIAVVVGAGMALPAQASARQLLTWTTHSAYVNPAKIPFNGPPPGVPPRPNALRVNVLLPDGYDGVQRFPVLYLLHGHGDSFDSWINRQLGDVRTVAKGFPGIIVMPEGAKGWYANWYRGGKRRGPAWERYYLDELIPLVERRLRIRHGRRWHAIAGLSMGGEGSMFFAEQVPGYFGSVASFSGPLSTQRPEWPAGMGTQGEAYTDVFGAVSGAYATGHNPLALIGNLRNTRIFVAVGNGIPNPLSPDEVNNTFGQAAELELSQHGSDFATAAQNQGDDVTYQPQQGIHDWPYWRKHLADAISWGLFKKVSERPAQWTYATVAKHGRMWSLRFDFAKAPAVLETFTRNGKTLSATGAGTVTIRTHAGHAFTATLPFSRTLP